MGGRRFCIGLATRRQWGFPAPRLFIHERCARLVECLPSLQHDPNRPEDVLKVDADEDGVGGDDAADCLRYLVATKERKSGTEEVEGGVRKGCVWPKQVLCSQVVLSKGKAWRQRCWHIEPTFLVCCDL